MRKLVILLVVLLFLVPVVIAGDRYFYVAETGSPYKVVPGDKLIVDFVLVNKDLKAPKNVTAHIEGCPHGWVCEDGVFSYEKESRHPENITIRIPKTAIPKKYTLYIKLESYYPVSRGDDKLIIDMMTQKDSEAISYEEYLAKQKAEEEKEEYYIPPEDTGAELVSVEETPEEEMEYAIDAEEDLKEASAEEDVVEETAPEPEEVEEDKTIVKVKDDVVENLERLESDRGFVEYATVVLLILLIVVGIGAILAFVKKDGKDRR